MENKLMTVANIRGYVDEHGTAMLNIADYRASCLS